MVTGNATIIRTLEVDGEVNAPGICWVSGRVSSTATPIENSGGNTSTVVRSPGASAGIYRISFPARPLGNGNYTVLVTG